MAQTMKDILNRMLNHEELSREEMKNILIGITHSDYPTEQITALLTALQMRGVTVDELLGFRDGILETGVPALLKADRYIDVVGTGGDRKNTFNIRHLREWCLQRDSASWYQVHRQHRSSEPLTQ